MLHVSEFSSAHPLPFLDFQLLHPSAVCTIPFLPDTLLCSSLQSANFRWETCKVFIKWASLIEINWIKFGLIK